jgi:hypothetical protein
MRTVNIKQVLAGTAAAAMLAGNAWAVEVSPSPSSSPVSSPELSPTPTASQSPADKLRACEAREAAITKIMDRMTVRAEKQVETFNTIATRTQSFSTRKGKAVEAQAELVADVAAKKAAVTTALDAAKAQADAFDCSAGDPKAQVRTFKAKQAAVRQALQSYKKSVNALIVAVKKAKPSVAPAPSGSPEASASPGVSQQNTRSRGNSGNGRVESSQTEDELAEDNRGNGRQGGER